MCILTRNGNLFTHNVSIVRFFVKCGVKKNYTPFCLGMCTSSVNVAVHWRSASSNKIRAPLTYGRLSKAFQSRRAVLLAELFGINFYTLASRAVKQSELLSRYVWQSWNILHKRFLLHDPENKIYFGIICRDLSDHAARPKSDMRS
jgi:hypothetical protein